MNIKRIIFTTATVLCELLLLSGRNVFRVIFIEMLLLFFGLLFVYSGLTKDPWLWDTPATKSLVTTFGVKGTQVFGLFGGSGILALVILMANKV